MIMRSFVIVSSICRARSSTGVLSNAIPVAKSIATVESAAFEAYLQGQYEFNRLNRSGIETALQHTSGRRQEAARLLGWGRNTLTRKLKELGLQESA